MNRLTMFAALTLLLLTAACAADETNTENNANTSMDDMQTAEQNAGDVTNTNDNNSEDQMGDEQNDNGQDMNDGSNDMPDDMSDNTDDDQLPDDGLDSVCDSDSQGTAVGDRALPFTLPQCDGTPFELDAQCGVKATNLILFTGWCPNCRDTIEDVIPARLSNFSTDFEPVLVITQTNSFGEKPNAGFCQQIVETYNIDYPVLYDADGFFEDNYGTGAGNDTQFVLDEDLIIQYRAYRPSDSEVDGIIQGLL